MNNRYDVVVIGGGPAGMAAALSAYEKGAKVLLVERDNRLGGILNQCIHTGFGLHYFGEELTGPEYADRFVKLVESKDIDVMLGSMVFRLSPGRIVEILSPEGYFTVEAGAVVLAMGCRERAAGSLAMAGTRPVGIYTAGMAQRLCNLKGYLVGKKVVILGSGDIGLIMARRMTIEGAKVELVLEIQSYSSGLKRNIVQCLNDYDIPIKYSHTITRLEGSPRLKAIYYAPVDENKVPILSAEKKIECDTLLLSVGLIPENDLLSGLDASMSSITSGAIVDENRMTSIDGVFSCGNVLHVHDLVDNVSREAEIAGANAADFAFGKIDRGETVKVNIGDGIKYVLPQKITKNNAGEVDIYFRVDNIYKYKTVVATVGNKDIFTKKERIISPGEMQKITLTRADIAGDVTVRLV